MCKNGVAAVEVGSVLCSLLGFESGAKKGLCPTYFRIILTDFVLKKMAKAMEEHRIIWESKTLIHLDYADDLSVRNNKFSR
jgi:hypothetical protein